MERETWEFHGGRPPRPCRPELLGSMADEGAPAAAPPRHAAGESGDGTAGGAATAAVANLCPGIAGKAIPTASSCFDAVSLDALFETGGEGAWGGFSAVAAGTGEGLVGEAGWSRRRGCDGSHVRASRDHPSVRAVLSVVPHALPWPPTTVLSRACAAARVFPPAWTRGVCCAVCRRRGVRRIVRSLRPFGVVQDRRAWAGPVVGG